MTRYIILRENPTREYFLSGSSFYYKNNKEERLPGCRIIVRVFRIVFEIRKGKLKSLCQYTEKMMLKR